MLRLLAGCVIVFSIEAPLTLRGYDPHHSQVVVCTRVGTSMQFIDANSLQCKQCLSCLSALPTDGYLTNSMIWLENIHRCDRSGVLAVLVCATGLGQLALRVLCA